MKHVNFVAYVVLVAVSIAGGVWAGFQLINKYW